MFLLFYIFNTPTLIIFLIIWPIRFAVAKVFPEFPPVYANLIFYLLAGLIDFGYRAIRIKSRPELAIPENAPIASATQQTKHWWLFNAKGPTLFFLPLWLFALFGILTGSVSAWTRYQEDSHFSYLNHPKTK